MASKTTTRNGDRRIGGRLDNYDDAFLLCRFRRHRWETIGFYRHSDSGHRVTISVVECDSCHTVREDWYDANGTLVYRRYENPDGYLFTYDEAERAESIRVRGPDVARALFSRAQVYESRDAFNRAAQRNRVKA